MIDCSYRPNVFYRKSCNPANAQLKINLTLKVTFHSGNFAACWCCYPLPTQTTYWGMSKSVLNFLQRKKECRHLVIIWHDWINCVVCGWTSTKTKIIVTFIFGLSSKWSMLTFLGFVLTDPLAYFMKYNTVDINELQWWLPAVNSTLQSTETPKHYRFWCILNTLMHDYEYFLNKLSSYWKTKRGFFTSSSYGCSLIKIFIFLQASDCYLKWILYKSIAWAVVENAVKLSPKLEVLSPIPG